MPAELTGVTQIGISVRDIDRATAFYRDTLGLPLLMNSPNMAFLDCGGVRLYLDGNPGSAEAGGNFLIYLRTSNIDQAHASLQQQGVDVHKEPHTIAKLPDRDILLMWIRDSESNLLGIMEERRK
jgi:catechol 2,3-dioxygenase-like lactoylglutathione lyase family enzyme